MNAMALIKIAKTCEADAIHPGYGYLSESGSFAKMVEESNLNFVGPPSGVVSLMGDKLACNSLMKKMNIPLLEGYCDTKQDDESLKRAARKVGFPLVIKPALGGGGKGITLVRGEECFSALLAKAKRESLSCFGDSHVILERYVHRFKHIECQIACDKHGHILHLSHRDCSIQRRFQKIIEEAPAVLPMSVERAMQRIAAKIAKRVQYVGVGTVEFILDCAKQKFYFMEMNTRLQVEHPVTESIIQLNGKPLDLVCLQLSIAMGLSIQGYGKRLKVAGHAIEARVYAENPSSGFVPQSGRVHFLKADSTLPQIRIDSVIKTGDRVFSEHDPMIAKVIARGGSRRETIRSLLQAVETYTVIGIENNLSFLRRCLSIRDFQMGNFDSNFVKSHSKELMRPIESFWKYNALAAMVISTWCHKGGTSNMYQALRNFRVNTSFSHEYKYYSPFLQEEITFWIEKASYPMRLDQNLPMLSYKITAKFENAISGSTSVADSKTFLVAIISSKSSSTSEDLSSECAKASYEVIIDESEKVSFRSFVYMETETRKVSLLFLDGSVHSLQSTVKALPLQECSEDPKKESKVRSPISGRVARLCVSSGSTVRCGDVLLYMHAMKMEHEVRSKSDGVIRYFVKENEAVSSNSLIASIVPEKSI
ncbi:methylcrotonoyl-coa carboxylase biotinylated subunitprotein-like protein [Perkinsela sp. CCAP 1560/4]|nr:methylcrotonoyl-coa carboxylase biotinylated subunitprotein-like protein [Perkinsela sp. CCAP 1560/4]|eukprot:KNH04888.1 methylcrotonoyl-coa carboxylase biotinylated subunitprotein-like protein [Perkinsela sp. CCAP 1560/4]